MPDEQWSKTELLPPEGHAKVGERVFTLLGEVISDKSNLGLPDKWLEHHKLIRNQYWAQSSTKVPLISVNLIHTHKQRTKNILTDNNPTFDLVELSVDREDERYMKLQRACEYWWIEEEQQSKFENSVSNGEDYGVAIEKVIWVQSREKGLGEVETVVVDPFQFGFYPVDCKDVEKAEAVFYYYPLSVRDARRKWPDMAEFIKPDSQFLRELGDERRELVSGAHKDSVWSRIGATISGLFTTNDDTDEEGADKTLVVECWVKDYTRETVEEQQEDGTVVPVSKYKYPGTIRCVTVSCGGKVLLSDRPNPSINPDIDQNIAMESYLYDRWPFTMVPSITDTSTAWGMSDIEQLEQLAKEFNRAISQLVFLKDKAARSKIVNPKTSGVPNDHFSNAPGIVNPKNSMEAAAIRYLDFPQVNVDIEKVVALFKDLFFLVSGSFELENAQTPGKEVIAYKAIAALLERAATMMRGKVRNYSRLLRERGRMYLSYVQNYYLTERWFTWEEDGETRADKIMPGDAQIPIKLTVVNGSTLPVSKVQQREEAIVLYDKQAIDRQDLLEKLEWPNRAVLNKRMDAGVMGQFIERMAAMGAPPEFLEILQEISEMDEKEFEGAIEQGEVPMLPWPDQPEDPEDTKLIIELDEAREKVQTERANRKLLEAKAVTERVKQRETLAGIRFDKQKLNIERAEVLSNIKMKEAMPENSPATKSKDQKPPATERGLKSNNKE